MIDQVRRLKLVLGALVVLAFSASVAFAGKPMPDAATRGLDTAAGAAGMSVPGGRAGDQQPDAEAPSADDGSDDGAELDADEPEGDAETLEQEAWDNHGDMVSTAAHMTTPEGFRNHGHFVSCVAHMAFDAEEPVDLETLTPEDCDEATDEDATPEESETEVDEAPVEESETEAWDNHGDMVSDAARMTEPEGFRNHGQFVSCVAHMDFDAEEPVDLATLTPEACAPVEDAALTAATDDSVADAGHGRGHGKDHAKAKGRGHGKGHNR